MRKEAHLRKKSRKESGNWLAAQGEMAERIRASMLPEQWEAIAQMHPLGLGRPRDVANAIAFLLSPANVVLRMPNAIFAVSP